MSALRLKANMLSVSIDVRYVPIADMAAAKDPRSQGHNRAGTVPPSSSIVTEVSVKKAQRGLVKSIN